MVPEPLDPRYVQARRVLLDALFALAPHRAAVIVAGAQAIYLRTGDADFAIAPFTIDSDFAINPSLLGDNPQLEAAMRGAGFDLTQWPEGHVEPGTWVTPALVEGRQELNLIPVDLIVPEGAAPPGGRRGARLGVQGNRAARRILGLEAALIDHSPIEIMPLDAADTRRIATRFCDLSRGLPSSHDPCMGDGLAFLRSWREVLCDREAAGSPCRNASDGPCRHVGEWWVATIAV